jgi:hypothetical protein
LGIAGFAQAVPTTSYKILINNTEVSTVGPSGSGLGDIEVALNTEFDVQIQIKVTDNNFDIGSGPEPFGASQASVSLQETGTGLTPSIQALTADKWKSTSTMPSILRGVVDSGGYDVLYETGHCIGNEASYYNSFGANVWTTVFTGQMKWDGTGTTLSPVPADTDEQLIIKFDGTSAYSAFPDATSAANSVEFLPEPATMGLLAIGGLALLRRRR